jgi:hypothetical protein
MVGFMQDGEFLKVYAQLTVIYEIPRNYPIILL